MSHPPPTATWGVLLRAAALLEDGPGLARLDTVLKDHKAGKLSVYDALQDALWPPPEDIPKGGIPQHDDREPRCALYWAAVRALDLHCGGNGRSFAGIDAVTEPADATATSVAEHMRQAAAALP